MSKKSSPDENLDIISRWRLVLGKDSERHGLGLSDQGGGRNGDGDLGRIEDLVGFLFEQGDVGDAGLKPPEDRQGGAGASTMTVPKWVDQVSELFPNNVKEVMEKELVKRRGISELLEKPELLEKVEPNTDLVKTLLVHKDLLNPKARIVARKIIKQVVDQLKEKMKLQVEQAINGAIRRDRHSPRRVFKNLDLKTTVKRNLKNFDQESRKLLVERLYFFASERKRKPWHVIVNVDQSGSMLDSAIFSAVMASIFYELPSIKTSLVLFDTQVVDLSDQLGEPVDVLLSINLGGGTDITQSLQYCRQLVREPGKTIVVTISDFFEGRPERDLVDQTRVMFDSGIRMIGLGALGYDARPEYNRSTAKKLRKVGMDILVCTPERLAECMGRIIRG
ncbi:VWA domain-containing protein [Candidatus Obscuribacterales bacterium]|nr:VWA domain-containing protein [Candidatus Obscuribacterales bacterium]MBX3153146.1 VWA domain-containing protein [Candidatus Obscuribacterales bacterium]